jgi:hypothetical protein
MSSKAEEAGRKLGEAISAMANQMYDLRKKNNFYRGLFSVLKAEDEDREKG